MVSILAIERLVAVWQFRRVFSIIFGPTVRFCRGPKVKKKKTQQILERGNSKRRPNYREPSDKDNNNPTTSYVGDSPHSLSATKVICSSIRMKTVPSRKFTIRVIILGSHEGRIPIP